MKPDFALTLSFDGIGLLMRADGAWRLVGTAPADATDLDSQLAALRDRAAAAGEAAKAGGLPVKLVIPDEQIRYLSLRAPAEGEGEAAARTALDGATPYAVSDLVIDRQRDGDRLCVAAVARETLEEAEEFAREHGFAPLCFTAAPEMGVFPGEVFFGPTAAAAAMQDQPQRDTAPARVPEPLAPDVETTESTTAAAASASAVASTLPAGGPLPDGPEEETGRDSARDATGEAADQPPTETQPSPALADEERAATPSDAAETAPAAPVGDAVPTPEAAPVSESAPNPETARAPEPESTLSPEAEPAPTEPELSRAAEEEAQTATDATAEAAEKSAAPSLAPSDSEESARVNDPDPSGSDAEARPGEESQTVPTTAPADQPEEKRIDTPETETETETETSAGAAPKDKAAGGPSAQPSGDIEAPAAPASQASSSDRNEPTAASTNDPKAAAESAPKAFTSRRAAQEAEPSAPGPRKPGKTAKSGDAPMPIPAFTPKPEAEEKAAPEPGPAAAVGFFSRRKQDRSEPAQTRRAEPVAPARKPAQERSATPKLARPAATPSGAGSKPSGPRPDAPMRAPATPPATTDATSGPRSDAAPARVDSGPSAPSGPAAPVRPPVAPPATSTSPAAPISRAALAAAVPVENPAFDEDEPEAGTTGDRRLPKTARDIERERMTVFGARRQDQIGGKPRYLGLMLTLALLLFLAGVFAWASVFMEDGLARFFGSDEPVVAALPETAGEDATDPSAPTIPAASEGDPTGEDTTQSADQTTAPAQTDQPSTQSELAAELAPEPEPEPEVTASADPVMIRPEEEAPSLPEPIRSEAISSEEAQARYAATGVWQRAPQPPQVPGGSEGTADIYVASIDRDVPSQDAIALPGTDAMMDADEPPQATYPPPPPGVRYRVDDRGLIVPSEDGIVAPGGYTLYSGQPGILPRPRPGSAAPATPEGEALPAENAPILASPEAAELIDIRPRLRPETLVEDNERVQLGGRSRDELATLRPRLRPEDLAPAPAVAAAETGTPEEPRVSEASGIAAQAMADAVAEAGEVELEEDFEAASDQAVAASLAPRARPGNMGSIVREAETAAPQQVAQAPRAVQPSIPSSASVARQATVENAINLRRINLIGVYGKPSNRRALVRLPNGRYEKVAVGDRIDGGRVAAIGETELRYVKGGRSLLLKMPNG